MTDNIADHIPKDSIITLENAFISIALSRSGCLQFIENRLSTEIYSIVDDQFIIKTDHGMFTNSNGILIDTQYSSGEASFIFTYPPLFELTLVYKLGIHSQYVERNLSLKNLHAGLHLFGVELGRTTFEQGPQESIKYDTFWNAPTVQFLRWEKGGVFSGIENPFFEVNIDEDTHIFSFEPSLVLAENEAYCSEPQFIGVYRRSFDYIMNHDFANASENKKKCYPRFRNPSGHIPIDLNEIKAMRHFASDFLEVKSEQFLFILYCYWFPLPQLPVNEEQENLYYKVIDQFKELGGDMIIFTPLAQAKLPTASPESFFELAPKDSAAERIMNYTRDKGLKFGFYMGVAANNAAFCNSSVTTYSEQYPEWKKIDIEGKQSKENCMASDAYATWFSQVQDNTIAQYDLSNWSWDPGPGNGFFCYSDKHGHIPGNGAYKGWRNAMALIAELKSKHPDLFIQGFYGVKEYGLWGLKGTDQHEAYWEQQVAYLATVYPELSSERMNADGIRFQSWWNENFRFLPTETNHALVHRITQVCLDDPELTKVWDHFGWKYGLMSGIAVAGSVTACILPHDFDNVYGQDFKSFYHKWLKWARDHYSYVPYQIAFGQQVEIGGIDGYARIKGDHGFIFLCNPAPRRTTTKIVLDEAIGFKGTGQYVLKELYPASNVYFYDDNADKGIYSLGDSITITVPSFEVVLYELIILDDLELPLLFNVSGEIRLNNGTMAISGVKGIAGSQTKLSVLPGSVPLEVSVNDNKAFFLEIGDYLHLPIRFEGQRLARELDQWCLPDGVRFEFPNHQSMEHLQICHSFYADPAIQVLLEQGELKNQNEAEHLVEKWIDSGFPDSFAWAFPNKLILVIPFTDGEAVQEVGLQINDKPIKVECYTTGGKNAIGFVNNKVIYYVDITERVIWGEENKLELILSQLEENQFLGPYLEYPPSPVIEEISIDHSIQVDDGVIYTRPVIATNSNADMAMTNHRSIQVVSAWITPEYLSENSDYCYYATVNIPFSNVEGVYVSTMVGGGVYKDHRMTFNRETEIWSLQLTIHTRVSIILDCKEAFIWVVDKHGGISESRKVKHNWLLT
ncbi:hypothetical protein [Paenibacillus spongiae]|uniref:Uncharacterized protein n=1 Tax=Paenibacillus spongiae TaxID=2909671 RepID=A0ABY5SFP1_9BACL|nr:hypothetical protein [Paenibacillus spongiae]UVI32792.1 hypothetical protein L1F29_13585 [Paenibacillus spongiae]